MGCSCQGSSVFGCEKCGCDIVQALIPCVDAARNVASCLGARPYTVTLVWTRWSGGSRGDGTEEVVREVAITPTPKIALDNAIQKSPTNYGIDESGTVQLTEISGRYTEDLLSGRDDYDGSPAPYDQQFFWEIRYPTKGKPRRRFTLKTAPIFDAENVQWVVTLLKSGEDRARDGQVGW